MDIHQAVEILGLKPDATLDEAIRAYKAQARIWHPDRFSDNSILRPRAEENIRRVNIAYAQVEAYLIAKQKTISWQKTWHQAQPASRKSIEGLLETARTILLKACTEIQRELTRLPLPDPVKRGSHFTLKAGRRAIQWGTERLARVGKGPWDRTKGLVQAALQVTLPQVFESVKRGSSFVVRRGKVLLAAFGRAAKNSVEKEKRPSQAPKEATNWNPSRARLRQTQGGRVGRTQGTGRRTRRRSAKGASTIDGIRGYWRAWLCRPSFQG
jgi:hypothetical protein